MASLIEAYPNSYVKSRGRPFETLIRAIVGQQISVKAADAIWARLTTHTPIEVKHIQAINEEQLRSLGLSQRKAEYIHAVCAYFANNDIHDSYFTQRSDEEIITELSSIRGIGRWSAEMFLIFTLMRPNVFPVDDIGLLRALERHYHHDEHLTPAKARNLYRERFEPWCSVATWYLWRSLDPAEIQY
ncbi:DNA-3-methyladenine glycosylase [Cardiobacteriaceae bacterium TAE3-ERU3]|nr:DNA-3-methyladenine glycosylase [Cardiobacteriaceae bacterium TAE3-ERU3]